MDLFSDILLLVSRNSQKRRKNHSRTMDPFQRPVQAGGALGLHPGTLAANMVKYAVE